MDLTSFLFGNINTSGQLEEEFLDESTKKQLNSLGSLLSGTNLNSFAREVSIDAEEASKEVEEDYDVEQKAADAEDYSNIEEMMDDDSSSDDSDDDDNDNEEDTEEIKEVKEEKSCDTETEAAKPEK